MDGSGLDSSPSSFDPAQSAVKNSIMAFGTTRLKELRTAMTLVNIPRTSAQFSTLFEAMRADLNSFEDLSRLYRAQWNADAITFNRLPLEISQAIFHLVSQDDQPRPPIDIHARGQFMRSLDRWDYRDREFEPQFLRGQGGSLGWIRLGHVCSHWRRALLAMPSIWAGALGALPSGFDTMLQRAKNLPLTIQIYSSHYRIGALSVYTRFLDAAGSDLASRTQTIFWYDMEGSTHQYLSNIFATNSFPLLETATLCIRLRQKVAKVKHTPLILAPRLRRLRLQDVFCRWSSEVLSHLHVQSAQPKEDEPIVSLRDSHLDFILRQSARSRSEIILRDCFEMEFADEVPKASPLLSRKPSSVDIPNLTSLTLRALADRGFEEEEDDIRSAWFPAARFIRVIKVPCTAQLAVTISRNTPLEDFDGRYFVEDIWRTCIETRPSHAYNGVALQEEYFDDPTHAQQLTISLYEAAAIASDPEAVHTIGAPFALVSGSLSITFEEIGDWGGHFYLHDIHFFPPLFEVLPPSQFGLLTHTGVGVYPHRVWENTTEEYAAALRVCSNVHTFTLSNPHDKGELSYVLLIMELLCSCSVFPMLKHLILHEDVDLPRLVKQLERRKRSFAQDGRSMSRLQLSIPSQAYKPGLTEDVEALQALEEFADIVLRDAVAC
ncbi:hypothetical protein PENSPDRAFT_747128 [Peniophora sp. CONT]|nr:hypothetical protein PENSPDRAFT_747128 [Peniophora sp. CONT]